jgi:hypothetical protein
LQTAEHSVFKPKQREIKSSIPFAASVYHISTGDRRFVTGGGGAERLKGWDFIRGARICAAKKLSHRLRQLSMIYI